MDISPLRESVPYRALLAGQIISLLGTQMRVVAVPFQVFSLTGSTAAVGLIGLAEVVPLIVFSMVGGALADALDRRRILGVTQTLLLVDSGALAALTFSGHASLPWIYGLVALGAAVAAVDQPARSAITPRLLSAGRLPAAMALRQVVFQTTQIAGPAVGGLIIAVTKGVEWLYEIDALTFLAALAALRWIPSVRPRLSTSDSDGARLTPGAVRDGLRYAFQTPLILSIFIIDLVAMIFGMPRAVFPALAQGTFGVGAFGLGILYAAPATGALAAALTSGWVSRVRRHGMAVLIAVTIWGAAITLAGLSLFSFPLALLCLSVAGGADVISAVFRGTMLLAATPDDLLGRVNSLNLMVVTGGPRLGDVEAGLVAQAVGAGPSVVVGGIACLIGTLGVAAASDRLRTYRTHSPDESVEASS